MKHQQFLAVLICDLMTEKSYFSESAVFGTDHMMLLLKDDRSGKMVKCSKSFLEGCNQCTEAHTKHRPTTSTISDNTYSNASLIHHTQGHHKS